MVLGEAAPTPATGITGSKKGLAKASNTAICCQQVLA